MAELLLDEIGPNGNIQAVVESDEQVCYFYLCGAPDINFGMRSVWVRNHTRAPDRLNAEAMRAGVPPQMPASFCCHPDGLAPLSGQDLRVVWLPEGNGAALFEGDEILAIIPPWSGTDGFHGYAREGSGEGPVAWELDPENLLLPRFDDAQSYWGKWDAENLWPSIQAELLTHVEKTFGPHTNYYAIDGGEWPPKALVRIPWQDRVVLITIGVSTRPQPNVEMHTEQPELLRRVELGSVLPKSWPYDAIDGFASYLSGQSNLPWHSYTWLGPGHTIPCDSWQNSAFNFALLLREHAGAPRLTLGSQFNDPVNVLWFVPISETERQQAIESSSDHVATILPAQRWEEA
jgi:hypothetical protein